METFFGIKLSFENIDIDFKIDVTNFHDYYLNVEGHELRTYNAIIKFYNLSNSQAETFDWKSVEDTWKVDVIFSRDALKGNVFVHINGSDRRECNANGICEVVKHNNVNLLKKGLNKDTYQGFEIPISNIYSADFDFKYPESIQERFELLLLEKLSVPVTFINKAGNKLVYNIKIVGTGKEAKFAFDLASGEYKNRTYTPDNGKVPNPKSYRTEGDFAQSHFFKLEHDLISDKDSSDGDGSYNFTGFGYFVLDMKPDSKKPVDTNIENNKDLPETGENQTGLIISLMLSFGAIVANGYYNLKRK